MNKSNEENKGVDTAKNVAKTADNLIGDGLALASNKVAPIVGPMVISILWKHKYTLLIFILCTLCFGVFALEAISLQFTANSRGLLSEIPADQRECIEKAGRKHNLEMELLSAYGKAIADFKVDHQGVGKGFLEISESDWKDYGEDGDSNKTISEKDVCDNYFTLGNKLETFDGDSLKKIEAYPTNKKEDVKTWYELYKGLMMIPYGNPIGLNRSDLATITSGYNVTRIIDGKKNVHKGLDVVPSGKWFQENPGKSSKDVINRSILYGTVTNFVDQNGALCSYVTNEQYRTLYCHCDAFIAQDNSVVKYGDPICFMGTTGFSTGVHCHIALYEKSQNGGWNMIDPTPFVFPTEPITNE